MAEFEEWVNVPLNETVDEVHQYISHNYDTEEERDLLGWWKKTTVPFSCYCQDWSVLYSASLQVVAAARETSVLLDYILIRGGRR